jgi:glycine hydroxymethyltransferase
MVTSGLRIGTAALATRGFTTEGFTEVADIIARTLLLPEGVTADDPSVVALRDEVRTLAKRHPLYPSLG